MKPHSRRRKRSFSGELEAAKLDLGTVGKEIAERKEELTSEMKPDDFPSCCVNWLQEPRLKAGLFAIIDASQCRPTTLSGQCTLAPILSGWGSRGSSREPSSLQSSFS